MSLVLHRVVTFAAGAAVNALMPGNGFTLPRPETMNGLRILRPGFPGNLLVSGVAASVSCGLYGLFADSVILGTAPDGGRRRPVSRSQRWSVRCPLVSSLPGG